VWSRQVGPIEKHVSVMRARAPTSQPLRNRQCAVM
jgi:hypothetical protein